MLIRTINHLNVNKLCTNTLDTETIAANIVKNNIVDRPKKIDIVVACAIYVIVNGDVKHGFIDVLENARIKKPLSGAQRVTCNVVKSFWFVQHSHIRLEEIGVKIILKCCMRHDEIIRYFAGDWVDWWAVGYDKIKAIVTFKYAIINDKRHTLTFYYDRIHDINIAQFKPL